MPLLDRELIDRPMTTAVATEPSSTSAGRCRPASPCSRRAPARARRTRSRRSRRATSPTACRSSGCCWSRSRGWRPASCAIASASGSSRTEQQLSRILDGAPDPRGRSRSSRCSRPAPRSRSTTRRDRLARAIADFDAATIATTHGFCQEVLAELGTVGDLEPGHGVRRGRRRPGRGGARRPLRPALPRKHGGVAVRPRARR